MEARTYFGELEHKLEDLEHKAIRDGHMAAEAALKLGDELKQAFRKFADRLGL
jgi:hypothetical protein